jgi:arylformamidase
MTNIFHQYDQVALDAQYNTRARYPDFKEHFESWGKWSEAARAELPGKLDVSFGPMPIEAVDIFPASEPLSPIYLFIHGGYWYSLDKSDYSYVAKGMRPHGVTTVVNNFGLAPDHSMDTIVSQNRGALAWLWKNAASFGGDRDRIYVCGHSAGGHLGAILLATDWPAFDAELPVNPVKGVCAIGGIFDLEPISLSFLNQKLHLTAEQVKKYSPLSLHYPAPAPLSLVVAVNESDEFHRQSKQMRERWKTLGWSAELLVPPNLDHFSVVNDLINPRGMLVQHQLQQMQLAFKSTKHLL